MVIHNPAGFVTRCEWQFTEVVMGLDAGLFTVESQVTTKNVPDGTWSRLSRKKFFVSHGGHADEEIDQSHGELASLANLICFEAQGMSQKL